MKRYSRLILILTVLWPLLLPAENLPALRRQPIILQKTETPVSAKTCDYLNRLNTPTVKIWVFFNDKGVLDKSSFDRAAAAVEINDHARNRRARAGLSGVVFADLPVARNYIEHITALGAEYRRSSRWLNAASFKITLDLIEPIAALPFVNRITPVAGFNPREEDTFEVSIPVPEKTPDDIAALDYGSSAAQMVMINIPAVHELGHNGQGVIVCLMDGGFRKTHRVFEQAYAENRVLAEYDFIFDDDDVQNEPEDDPSQHNHGTYCWSVLGGWDPGNLIGPAYGASFLLAKTEDIRSETPVEEDNWVAALEWADSLGADVTSTSLSYSNWYEAEDFDGQTAVITVAANTAASLGIIACNSAGNYGPAPASIKAPADGFELLAVGAVNSFEDIASFSSRGPTYDGRLKPEVSAMGVSDYCANGYDDSAFTYKSGTSFSCPIVAGAAAVLLSARPDLTPWQIRKILMKSADRADAPDNNYGWGIIDVLAALEIEDVCGDADDNGSFTLADFDYLTAYFYEGGPALNFPESGDVDSINGLNHNDLQYLADYFYGSSAPGPYCRPYPVEDLIISDDTLEIRSPAVPPGQTSCLIELYLKTNSAVPGLALPFLYSCSTATPYLDSISFTGSRYESYSHRYGLIDQSEKKGLLGIINTGENIPGSEEGLIASLHFTLASSSDTQHIFIDTTIYSRYNEILLSRATTRLEAVRPVITGLNRFVNPILHVMTTGSDETGDGNLFNPFATIQKAINELNGQDTILVHEGVYIGEGNVNIEFFGHRVVLKSAGEPGLTVIDGANSARGFHVNGGEDSLTVIDGFTVINGFAAAGGALDCVNASPTFKNCVFAHNSGWGGALFCNGSSPHFINCTFACNSSTYNTLGGAVFCLGMSGPLFKNCIFAFNAPGDAFYCQDVSPGPILQCCDVFGNEAGDWTGCIADQKNIEGNFSFDPFFCDTLADNYDIRAASLCSPEHNDCHELIGAGQVDSSCVGCCDGLTGNIDCSAEDTPDLDDILRLIDYLYLSAEPLCCLEAADCNGSYGEPDITDITRLIDHLYLSHSVLAPCK
ncbi:MAG: S8 family serine peptidase [Candidatus Zixiibacteriota bacterium]